MYDPIKSQDAENPLTENLCRAETTLTRQLLLHDVTAVVAGE